MKVLKQSTVSKVLLIRLYRDFLTDAYERPGNAELSKMFDGRLSKSVLDSASDALAKAGWVEKKSPTQGRYQIVLQDKGRAEAERLLEIDDPESIEYFKNGSSFFDQFEGLPLPRRDKPPTPDALDADEWQPLKLDRQRPEFKAALSKTEKALDIIRGDNGYADAMPEERNEVVRSLEAGVESLKQGAPTLQKIKALLIAPLKFVANRFVGAALGEAAKDAVASLLHWIGNIL